MWSVRTIISAVTAAGVAAGAGRAMLNRQIDRQADDIIARGVAEARQRVKDGASTFLTEAWRDYAIACVAKLLCLGVVLVLAVGGVLTPPVAASGVGVFLIASICYDVFVRRDLVRSVWKHIRAHGVRPRTIVRNLVATEVFAEAMQSVQSSQPNLTNRVMMALSDRNRDELERKVALAVSETASSFAWDDIRPFLRAALLRLAGLMLVYSSFVAAIVYVLNAMPAD